MHTYSQLPRAVSVIHYYAVTILYIFTRIDPVRSYVCNPVVYNVYKTMTIFQLFA